MLLASLCVVGAIAWHRLSVERGLGTTLATLSRAERYHLNADMQHDALHADVQHALRIEAGDSAAAGQVLANARENSRHYAADLDALDALVLPSQLQTLLIENRRNAEAYIALANKTISLAVSDRSSALALEPKFSASFDDMLARNDRITEVLVGLVDSAERAVFETEGDGKLWITTASIVTVVVAWIFVAFIAGSIRRSLRQVSDAARALAAGNLTARSEVASHDEVGELAVAMNKMADDLQNMIDKLLAEADRDAFTAQLGQALEMAESESDVRDVVLRAMPQVSDTLPMELLVAEGARGALTRFAEHSHAGRPGCDVESLANCAAVRRGSPVVFEDSEALNACPRLRGRPCGAVSAVCVPMSFMGRSLGVFHTTGVARKPPAAQKIAQLTALGLQAGARIGALRAFAQTQRQARTDGLTGVSNRRALEEIIAELTAAGTPYALALADLDHFKQLNDSHGHEAGDRALCLFARVLKECVRDGDHVARWGGEEFAMLFPGSAAAQAADVAERIRATLAEALLTSGGALFTASFGITDAAGDVAFESVMRMADAALYRAKSEGRDRVSISARARDDDPTGPPISQVA